MEELGKHSKYPSTDKNIEDELPILEMKDRQLEFAENLKKFIDAQLEPDN